MKYILILIIAFTPLLTNAQIDDNIAFDIDNFYDSENLLFATKKIDVYRKSLVIKNKIDTSSGTAFIFSFQIDSLKTYPVIVTNKHVIKNGHSFSFLFTRKDKFNYPQFGLADRINLSTKEIQWIFHPDTLIDLAITPLYPILDKLPKGRNGYALYQILENDIPLQNELKELKGVEEILMIGYPIGIWDRVNNMPITRRGITASHPILDYENKPEFVIDAACFPGSSGSPILIVNEGGYSIKTGYRMGRRRLFMGILYGGPVYQPDGEIKIIEIPTKKDAIRMIQVPLNLGYVIKSTEILKFKNTLGIN